MTDANTSDLLKNSVAAGDAMHHEGSGVFSFVFPFFWFNYSQLRGLPRPDDLPIYWSFERDIVLRQTYLHESFWGAAITIAATRVASQSYDLSGPARQIANAQQMMYHWSGRGYVPSQERGVADYLQCDNGEFHEIVRVSKGAGSRVIGLVHLDSLRCQRTGDPDIPVLYRDLKGYIHELHDYQVIAMSDMEDPGAAWFGVGHSAASRAYPHIYRMAAIERYVSEKLTGAGADKLTFLRGISTEQIQNLLNTKEADAARKGFIYYQGSVLAGILGEIPLEKVEVPLKGLPENFDRKRELDIGLLNYADCIGIDPQDLQPLSGQGLGTGAQSRVLFEKARGKGIYARNKQLAHELNLKVFPSRVTFTFRESDLEDTMKQAEIASTRATTRATQVGSGEITASQATQLAVDQGDVPTEFLTTPDATENIVVPDDTKPIEAAEEMPSVQKALLNEIREIRRLAEASD